MRRHLTFFSKFLWAGIFAGISFASLSVEIDSSKIERMCTNITPQQKQMATAAGYDVDAVCESLGKKGKKKKKKDKEKEENISVRPRGSVLETNDRGIIKVEYEQDPEALRDIFSGGNEALGQYILDSKEKEEEEKEKEEKEKEEKELKRYGYDLFAGVPTTFAPTTDIPTPVDYIVGPGDTIQVQLIGKVSFNHELVVKRNGMINFPDLGVISVSGLNFVDAKELIKSKVSESMIGVKAIVSLGELRSIRVFVLGEAYKPGSYTVSSLSTMTNALFVSGGINDIGSLRNIQLKRNGQLITTLDLYDLLQNGDTSGDARLQPGDVIHIPPVGKTVSVDGEVNRPAIYEMKGDNSLKRVIQLAGGLSSKADPNMVSITRNSASGFSTVLDINLADMKKKSIKIKNGDLVEVSTVLEEYEDVVLLSGHFHRPRAVKWKKALRVSDVIKSVRDFKDNADLEAGLIIRREMPLRKISVLSFNINKALSNKGSKNDVLLKPLDEIISFDMTEDRPELLEDLLTKISQQTSSGKLIKSVEISGNVRFPGLYPLGLGMDVIDLIELAGGLKEATYVGNAEITRRDLTDPEVATVQHINLNLENLLNEQESFVLEPKDKLSVYATPEYRENLTLELKGEVRFPGRYEFKRGETLSQVINRAGGFTPLAHVEASVFTREDLRIQEAKQLKELKEKLESELAANELEEAAAGEKASIEEGKELVGALADTEALGRLVIKLDKIMAGTLDDIRLKDGDSLVVPTLRQEVSVLGEVQHATSHLFNGEWTLEDYLEGSGGVTERADEDRIYVVRADGSVFLPNQGGWLTHQNAMLSPGDTIVIPLETDKIKSLTLWTNVSQIVYQLALGAAAVKSL